MSHTWIAVGKDYFVPSCVARKANNWWWLACDCDDDRAGDGRHIAQDPLGIAYGEGPTPDEALNDLMAVVGDKLGLLRQHRHQLSPELRARLEALEALFPER